MNFSLVEEIIIDRLAKVENAVDVCEQELNVRTNILKKRKKKTN